MTTCENMIFCVRIMWRAAGLRERKNLPCNIRFQIFQVLLLAKVATFHLNECEAGFYPSGRGPTAKFWTPPDLPMRSCPPPPGPLLSTYIQWQ